MRFMASDAASRLMRALAAAAGRRGAERALALRPRRARGSTTRSRRSSSTAGTPRVVLEKTDAAGPRRHGADDLQLERVFERDLS